THKFIGIYATNRIEWVLTYLGAAQQSVTIVPLYDTLGADAVQFCVNQSELTIVACDNNKRAKMLLDCAKSMPTLRTIVLMDVDSEGKDVVKDLLIANPQITLQSWADFEKTGATKPDTKMQPATKKDLYIVCYTSGTTGNPKGVMLTHANILSCPHAFLLRASHVEPLGPGKISISYLPLAHIFEQVVHMCVLYRGGAIGFYRGNTLKLLDDVKVRCRSVLMFHQNVQALKPHLFPIVPRLLSRLYDKVQSNVSKSNALAQWLYHTAYANKLSKLKRGVITRNTIWDSLIFKKIQAEIGGNVEVMITGAAPISGEVLEMCRVTLGCAIIEGYGQTECSAACSVTMIGDATTGHVGPPIPCNTIKLMDVPDMQYYARDNKGEVCIRGANVMVGYYKEPEKTAEALDADGWLHTGDVGMWLPNGTLKIIDRKKHIFKLAQGEYVAPEKIENVYVRLNLIGQIFVDGDSHQRYLVAIVVPDEHECRAYLRKADARAADATFEQMCTNQSLVQHILDEMNKFAAQNKLNSIEK
ncbi:unnamed protein product, partial [Sphagnum balticum]